MAVTFLYDCWTEENQWLSIGELAKKLGFKAGSGEYSNLAWSLREAVKHGIFERKKELRNIAYTKKNRKTYKRIRKVYVYKPKDWVLKSVCDGYFDEKAKKIFG